ncbi:cornifelin isoform X1 [Gorilla gorilla gorilla]|uniref:cornifelin isoform X1 n=1 Tax=Gorilla gorilla gorilla TaxID=9595 RepID=UPI002445DCA3|nr:cornifelin isoform X1 [Gorilla gorilla gorilla]
MLQPRTQAQTWRRRRHRQAPPRCGPHPSSDVQETPTPRLTRRAGASSNRDRLGLPVPRCSRREGGGTVVSLQWAAWQPRPDCPADGRVAEVRGPGGAARLPADPYPPTSAAMSYPVTSQPQCATTSCYQTQLSDWHTGLTDCCNDMPVCLCGTFAPLCLACRISDDFGECCCAPYLPGGLHSIRTGMRERYHIQGSVGHDWAALTFCLPCALCQMARELKIRE